MAALWIKIEHGLIDKPEVMQIADELDLSVFEVVGHLVAFWTWVDLNLSLECPVAKGTKKGLDRVAGRDGFCDAMVNAGWLTMENGMISIPNYDSHLSQSAKTRGSEQKKKAKQRVKTLGKTQANRATTDENLSPKCPDDNGTKTGQHGGPEKRREEKNKEERNRLFSEVLEMWNRSLSQNCELTQSRVRSLSARSKNDKWRESWKDAIARVSRSRFCRGENERKWKADLDWFLKPDTVTKVLEGKYDNRDSEQTESDVYADYPRF